MIRRTLCLVALAAAFAIQGSSAQAITYGQLDNGAHPEVGALIADWREPGVFEQLCSGTLIDEDVFLTAAHCVDFLPDVGIDPDEVWVSFADDVDPVDESTLIGGTYVMHPNYTHAQSNPNDLALILLDSPVSIEPARLPEIGLFDRLYRQNKLGRQRFTAVGYGVQERQKLDGTLDFPFDGRRRFAVETFRALNKYWLRLSQNPSTGDAGACYGDSGGPNFLGAGARETNIIASITVTGDVPCRATNVTLRLDTQAAQGFITPYLD